MTKLSSLSTISALFSSTAGTVALAAGLSLLPAQPALAWWTCPTDKPNFEQRSGNNSHVRCSSETQYRAPDECPNATAGGATVGTGIQRDWQGGQADKCVAFVGGAPVVVISPTCNGGGSGFVLQTRPQPNHDRCMKPGGSAAPTRNVN